MTNKPTAWRITPPARRGGQWTIVILTVDELGVFKNEAKGDTYDDAVDGIKEARAERQADVYHKVKAAFDRMVSDSMSEDELPF